MARDTTRTDARKANRRGAARLALSGARRPGAMMVAAACVWAGAIAGFGVARSLPAALALLALADAVIE